MKVQCDVCAAEAASVFCCADEAALCDACDRRVHRANKLAGKHRRFSLLHPCSSSSAAAQKPPLCDICQERRGFLFCKEDRAILCRECDAPVHSASDMTRRHSRFLLTGVRLSSAPVESAGPSEEEEEEQENSTSPCNDGSCSAGAATTASARDGSSISEYLTKTLPGWHVEDFLIDDASAGDVVGACSDGLYQGQHGAYMPWTGREQVLADVADEQASWERWVPQMHAEFAGDSKRPRASPSPPCSYWEQTPVNVTPPPISKLPSKCGNSVTTVLSGESLILHGQSRVAFRFQSKHAGSLPPRGEPVSGRQLERHQQ